MRSAEPQRTVFSNPRPHGLTKVSDQTNDRGHAASCPGQRNSVASRCTTTPTKKWSQQDYAHMSAFFSYHLEKNRRHRLELWSTRVAHLGQQPKDRPVRPARWARCEVDCESTTTLTPGKTERLKSTSPQKSLFRQSLVNRYGNTSWVAVW